jgi:hypothetical protein
MPSSPLVIALATPLAVESDGEAVCLVADPLQQVEPVAAAGQDDREGLAGKPHLFESLGQADDRHVDDAELLQDGRTATLTCGSPPSTTTRLGDRRTWRTAGVVARPFQWSCRSVRLAPETAG